MATRRDQLQSYQFLTQRVISAFVMRETDPAQSPLRRGVGAVFGGIMVAVLVAAVFGVYGLLTKIGNSNWKSDGSVVIEKETGATFVYLNGVLHPTLNYTSALLASGHPQGSARRVASASLSDVPRGVTLGIPGAPNSLPRGSHAIGLPWSLCSARGTDNAGSPTTAVTLAAGVAPTDAHDVGNDQALLVRDRTTSSTFLIWDGHRFPVRDASLVVPALFGAASDPALVGTSWINAIPAGVDIGTISVSGRGSPSSAMPGYQVGDIVVAQSGTGQSYYLVLDDGLAPITELQQDILAAQYPAQPKTISQSAAAAAKHSGRDVAPSGAGAPPQRPPALTALAGSDLICAKFTDVSSAPTISIGGAVANIDGAVPTKGVSGAGVSLADRVLVPPGRVELIRTVPGTASTIGAYSIITDTGIRYPVSQPALVLLGYDPRQAVDVPASLVARLPEGPALDPAAARAPAPAGGT